jgi:hypothetical protein
MKGDGLSKLYDTLSLDELFRLRLAAMARGDRVDCDRLDRACTYGQAHDYRERLAAAELLTLCVLVELGQKLAKLEMLDAVRPLVELLEGAATDAAWMGYLDGYGAGWKAAGKRGEPPAVSDATLDEASGRAYGRGTRISGMLEHATVELAGMARTPRDGLAAFAEAELGVSLGDLLGAWAPGAVETLADHAEALDAAAPDAERMALFGEVLSRAWRRHGLHDATAELDDKLRARIEAATHQEHVVDA